VEDITARSAKKQAPNLILTCYDCAGARSRWTLGPIVTHRGRVAPGMLEVISWPIERASAAGPDLFYQKIAASVRLCSCRFFDFDAN